MRFNHGCFQSHLFRIGVVNSPICNCDNSSIADLNHIFLSCQNYTPDQLWQRLQEKDFYFPLNLSHILSTGSFEIYEMLNEYCARHNINI